MEQATSGVKRVITGRSSGFKIKNILEATHFYSGIWSLCFVQKRSH